MSNKLASFQCKTYSKSIVGRRRGKSSSHAPTAKRLNCSHTHTRSQPNEHLKHFHGKLFLCSRPRFFFSTFFFPLFFFFFFAFLAEIVMNNFAFNCLGSQTARRQLRRRRQQRRCAVRCCCGDRDTKSDSESGSDRRVSMCKLLWLLLLGLPCLGLVCFGSVPRHRFWSHLVGVGFVDKLTRWVPMQRRTHKGGKSN